MSFTLHLAQDVVDVDAGGTTPVGVVVTNRGTTADRYEIEVEGIDAEWKAVPVPVFGAEPSELHTEKFFVKPPRASESAAGSYPFVVKVRSLETGETKIAQGMVRLKPFHHLTMEIGPKKGVVSPVSKRNDFTVTLVNLGNTEHTVQLVGSDPEDVCTYDFESDPVTLGPGQQREVEVTVNPTNSPVLSSGRLIGFSVTGRSVDVPSVVASAQAQLEQRSLLSPTTIGIGALLAVIIALWLMMMPKPPGIKVTVDRVHVTQGDQIVVRWAAHDATDVEITVGEDKQPINDATALSGEVPYKVTTSGLLLINAVAKRGDQRATDTKQITVDEPVVTPPPTIGKFSASATSVRLGAPVTFSWQVRDATRVAITPVNDDLSPDLQEFQITPTQTGTQEYTLVAFNKDGQTARSKPIRVRVYQQSDANVIVFTATPTSVREDDPRTTLTWQVTGAVRVELQPTGGTGRSVDAEGSLEQTLTGKTTFVLTAYDTNGLKVTKSLTVNYTKLPTPPPTDTTGDTTTTAGTTGSTAGTDPASTPTTGSTAGTTGTATTAGGLR